MCVSCNHVQPVKNEQEWLVSVTHHRIYKSPVESENQGWHWKQPSSPALVLRTDRINYKHRSAVSFSIYNILLNIEAKPFDWDPPKFSRYFFHRISNILYSILVASRASKNSENDPTQKWKKRDTKVSYSLQSSAYTFSFYK